MSRRGRGRAVVAALIGVVTFSLSQPVLGASGGTVYLSTVPATAGVSFEVGGGRATTGIDGSARVSVAALDDVAATVQLADGSVPGGDTVSISHIQHGAHVPGESHLSIGLDVTTPVRLRLSAGSTGIPVDAVHQVRLHAITGDVVLADPRRRTALPLLSRRTRLVHGVLATQVVTWSVDRVTAAQGEAITTSQRRFDPASSPVWKLRLQPASGTLVVYTVPRTAGVVFTIDGGTLTTDRHGVAVGPVGNLNDLNKRIALDGPHAAGGLTVSNLRTAKLPPGRPHQRRLTAVLDVRRSVALRLTDLNGTAISPSRIAGLTFSTGNSFLQLSPEEVAAPVAMLTKVSSRVNGRWTSRDVRYTLRSVRMDGGQAVFNGRQRFVPGSSPVWTISLAVFALRITAHDALFGQSIDSRIVIARPNGSSYTVQVKGDHPAVAHSLVRGLYQMRVDSAVLAGSTTVLVSRNDAIDLRVVTLLDVVLIVLVVLVVLIAAVVGGGVMARRRRSAVNDDARSSTQGQTSPDVEVGSPS
jgi:hypothetical protein